MLLVAYLCRRLGMQALLVQKAVNRGPQFLAALLAGLVTSARDLARAFADNPEANFAEALRGNPKEEPEEVMARGYISRFLGSASLEESLAVGTELHTALVDASPLQAARVANYAVMCCGQLVELITRQADEIALERIRDEGNGR